MHRRHPPPVAYKRHDGTPGQDWAPKVNAKCLSIGVLLVILTVQLATLASRASPAVAVPAPATGLPVEAPPQAAHGPDSTEPWPRRRVVQGQPGVGAAREDVIQPTRPTLRRQHARSRPAQPPLPMGEDPLPGVHMVYMYANGSDPGIAGPRAAFGGARGVNRRDRDSGEMRYSLRSLDKFAPWFRGDIIVLQGDDKPPNWLNLSHPRVKVVNHHQYFLDKSVLPTFNSDAIHVNIHRVPGVGERFINWCDDFFLGAPVEPTDWFKDGKPVVYFEKGTVRGGLSVYESLKKKRGNKWAAKIHRTRGLVEQEFPDKATDSKAVLHFVKHAPFPMSLPILKEMAATWPQEYATTAKFKFRDYETVDIPTLHNMYCQMIDGCVVPSQAEMDAASVLIVLKSNDEENMAKLNSTFNSRKSPPKFFTFNDGWTTKEDESRPKSVDYAFNTLLPSMFPYPSQYEIGSVPW